MTIDLRNQPTTDKGYAVVVNVRLVIAGSENKSSGYSLGVIPTGRSGRQVFGGPMVAGPWAFASGNATVIDNHGGTGRERDTERAEGRLIECSAGDVLVIADDLSVTISVDRRGYPHLTNVA